MRDSLLQHVDFAVSIGAIVKRNQSGETKRPSAIRGVRQAFEIDGIERGALADPVISRPAQKAKPAGPQIRLSVTEELAAVKVLGLLFESGGARFKDQYVFEVLCQLNRQCDSSGATPDYRDTAANVGNLI